MGLRLCISYLELNKPQPVLLTICSDAVDRKSDRYFLSARM